MEWVTLFKFTFVIL